ncbi:efflux RND transporter periplasmic adaptor subunit [Thiocystis violacea]|uniref:efflux RND transporter periplasmic adaptor subunit n=1 Tax=Thiocystis violacea TaxID=13725 RepID=UPI0019038BE6|nr:efflux RND transporter periplasmic adaptor subunit [Thiocystis violacea]MBK1722693.1 efflux transporter periplasmic adaptor subunit [Thiocystis violacea]
MSRLSPPTLKGSALGRLLILTLTLALQGPSRADELAVPQEASTNAALTVATVLPETRDWPINVSANGSLSAWQEAIVASEIAGLRVVSLTADVGDQVKRGEELALLSQDMVLADLALQKARLAQADAALSEAQANGKRARELAGKSTLSEQQAKQYLVAEESAKANLAAAEAQLKAQQIRLEQTHIRAVDNGVISARSATLGSVVQVGTELFRLVRQNRIEWRAEVLAEQLARILPGQTAHIRVAGGGTLEGRVRMPAPTFDPKTRMALVYVDLPDPGSARAGDFARGLIDVGHSDTLTVPESALVLRDGNAYVFEVGDNGQVVQHKVATGRRRDGRVEITGLAGAVPLVSSGGAFLKDGDRVRRAPAREATAGQP